MTTEQRFWNKVKKTKNCWNWTGSQRRASTYKRGNFRPGGIAEKVTVSRFSWVLHNGAIPAGICVLHKCDNGLCVRPDHLFLGTLADNIHDMDRKGRRKTTLGYPGLKGHRNPMAKLTAEDVISIRRIFSSGKLPQHKIAEKFKVSQTLISAITRKIIWGHVY